MRLWTYVLAHSGSALFSYLLVSCPQHHCPVRNASKFWNSLAEVVQVQMNVGTQYPFIGDIREHLHVILTTLWMNSKFFVADGTRQNIWWKCRQISWNIASSFFWMGWGHPIWSRYSVPANRERLYSTKAPEPGKISKKWSNINFFWSFQLNCPVRNKLHQNT